MWKYAIIVAISLKTMMKEEGDEMSLFRGSMHTCINGNKELTEHADIITLNPEKVSIPLYLGTDMNPEILVHAGDEVKVGTKIAQFSSRFVVPIYSSVSGTVEAIEDRLHQSLKKIKHVVISNDMKYTKEDGPTIDYESSSVNELTDFMMNAGIIGCGGAGFPSYMKYKDVKNITLLIINAVECEPYITSDYKILETGFEKVLIGIKAMLKMSGADKAVVAIKKSHPELIEQVSEKLKDHKEIQCVSVPDVYPMGWERTLVYQLTKKRYDKLPAEIGCIVNNATTAYMFGKAMTVGEPIVSRMLTVSGNGVKEPKNVIAPIGSSVHDVIEACGGYTSEDLVVCFGGPMMGSPITTDALSVERQNNAITVLKKEAVDEVACLRCGSCSDHCPSGLQPVRIVQANKLKDLARLEKLEVSKCVECGMCTYVCPSKIAVTENVRRAKRAYQMAKAKK